MLFAELLISLVVGITVGKLLQHILSLRVRSEFKAGLILLLGYTVFALAAVVRDLSHSHVLPVEIFLEPLLISLIGGFFVTNFSRYRSEFAKVLHDVSPPIYVVFFTLTGASLALDVMITVWPIALILFLIRLVGIFIGSFVGGTIAGDPVKHNKMSWMAYITQAGVGLGLAKEVAVEFPVWGPSFATMIIAVIVMNQIIGPPFFKWVLHRVGEAHDRADGSDYGGNRKAIIFGSEDQDIIDIEVQDPVMDGVALQDLQLPDIDSESDESVVSEVIGPNASVFTLAMGRMKARGQVDGLKVFVTEVLEQISPSK